MGNFAFNSRLKTLCLGMALLGLTACSHDTQPLVSKAPLSSAKHQQLVIKTRQAILDLDQAQVDALTRKIDVNSPLPDKSSLLAWAVETQEPALVRLLLSRGATVNPDGGNRFSPLIEACRYGNQEIIIALLEQGADPNAAIEDGTNAVQLCAASAPPHIMASLIEHGASITAANDYGQTALMFAANAGNSETMRYLADAGAQINQQTQQGYSPLFFAIKSHNLTAVKTALALGADLSATAKDGTTAAQLAVYAKNYEFLIWYTTELETLMSKEAARNVLTAFDRDGYQLLHAAVKANQPELVAALLNAGADPLTVSQPSTLSWRYEANFKTENYIPPQLTPLALAQQNKLEAIAQMLQADANRGRI